MWCEVSLRHMIASEVELDQSPAIEAALPSLFPSCLEHLLRSYVFWTITVMAIAFADCTGARVTDITRRLLASNARWCDKRGACRPRAVCPVGSPIFNTFLFEVLDQAGAQVQPHRRQWNSLTAASWWK